MSLNLGALCSYPPNELVFWFYIVWPFSPWNGLVWWYPVRQQPECQHRRWHIDVHYIMIFILFYVNICALDVCVPSCLYNNSFPNVLYNIALLRDLNSQRLAQINKCLQSKCVHDQIHPSTLSDLNVHAINLRGYSYMSYGQCTCRGTF